MSAEFSTWRSGAGPELSTGRAHWRNGRCHLSCFTGRSGRHGDLGRAGFSRHRLATAVSLGTIVRIRRGHYGLPQDSGVYRAARELKGLLTCVSAAPCYSLWTLAPAHSMHLCLGHRPHRPALWPTAAAGTIRHPWLPVAGLADILIHALHCLPDGGPCHGPVCGAAGGTSPWPSSAASSKVTATDAPGRCWTLSFRGPIRCWKFSPTLPSAGPGCTCADAGGDSGVGEVDFLVEDSSSWRPTVPRLEPLQVKKDRRRNNASILTVTSYSGSGTTTSSTPEKRMMRWAGPARRVSLNCGPVGPSGR